MNSMKAEQRLAYIIGLPESDIRHSLDSLSRNAAYRYARIPKVRGGYREIMAPERTLKAVQRAILERLLYQIPVHLIAHGFCRDRDIFTNARSHQRARALINHDLKDAFPSVRKQRVRANLERHVQRLLSSQFGHECDSASHAQMMDLLLCLLVHNDSLPQGSPASPGILNIVCLNLDRELFAIAVANNLTVTRYADDITVSSIENVIPGQVRDQIRSCISRCGWKINRAKSSYHQRSHGNALEVTGLLIHEDGSLTIEPERRQRYRKYLLEQLKAARPDVLERTKAEGIIAFARRVYNSQLPSDLRVPIERLEHQLARLPPMLGNGRRMNHYGPNP